MNPLRRSFLKLSGAAGAVALAIGAGLMRASAALAAWNKAGFDAKATAEALKSLGAAGSTPSKDILIRAPEIAENGAQVPIEVTSRVPNTQSLSIVVDKNPFPLNSTFDFANGAEPFVSTRIKLGQTSSVIVVVRAGDKFFTATKEIKVTIGGCGG